MVSSALKEAIHIVVFSFVYDTDKSQMYLISKEYMEDIVEKCKSMIDVW